MLKVAWLCSQGYVGWKPLMVSHYLAVFGSHWSSASEDITYLICDATT